MLLQNEPPEYPWGYGDPTDTPVMENRTRALMERKQKDLGDHGEVWHMLPSAAAFTCGLVLLMFLLSVD